jgi:hypothetical protein
LWHDIDAVRETHQCDRVRRGSEHGRLDSLATIHAIDITGTLSSTVDHIVFPN